MKEDEKKITFGQRIFDNIFLLLAAGFVIPFIFYFAWGVIEVLSIGKMPNYHFGGK